MLPTSDLEIEESVFDVYLDEFATIVDLASTVISQQTSTGGFSLDLGIVPALAWTATICHHHRIRHDALHLLSLTTQEGSWDPRFVGQPARGVMTPIIWKTGHI
jgi:hypothetical protein